MGDTAEGSWGSRELMGHMRREKARSWRAGDTEDGSCGAIHPCQQCGMSQRNTVHCNKQQFGYHAYVERKDDSFEDVLDGDYPL